MEASTEDKEYQGAITLWELRGWQMSPVAHMCIQIRVYRTCRIVVALRCTTVSLLTAVVARQCHQNGDVPLIFEFCMLNRLTRFGVSWVGAPLVVVG